MIFLSPLRATAQTNDPSKLADAFSDIDTAISVFTEFSHVSGNEDLGPFIDIPDVQSAEFAAFLEGRTDKITARARLSAVAANPDNFSDLDARLLELAWDEYIGGSLSLRFGKTFVSWDPGFVTQPVGFFQDSPDFADITDFESRLEGVWLASLNYGWTQSDISLVVAETPNDDRLDGSADVQVAARYSREINDVSVAGIVRSTDQGRVGLGSTLSTSVGSAVIAQGSIFYDSNATRSAVGATATGKSGISLSGELSYDELNADNVEFIASTPPRFFGDLRASYGRGDWAASIGLRHGFEEAGGLVTTAMTYNASDTVAIRLEAGLFFGNDDTQFGRTPVSDFVGMSLLKVVK